MEPGREDDAVGARRDRPHDLCQVVVERGISRLEALTVLGDVMFIEVDVHFVESKMIFDPLDALGGGLHLGEVVVTAFLSADDGGDHGGDVDLLFVKDRPDPAGSTGIDMGIARKDRAGTHRDEGRVSAAAEHRDAGDQSEVFRRFGGQRTDLVGRFADLRQMLHVDVHHVADLFAPALMPLAGVIKERRERGVLGHDTFAGAAADEIFLDVEPLVDLVIDLGFVVPDPEVLEDGVLDGGGHRMRVVEIRQKLEQVGAGDLRTVRDGLFEFLFGTLVHVGHGRTERAALFVDQDDALHLTAEGDAVDLFRPDFRLGEDFLRGDAHRLPPFLDVLLDPAVVEDRKAVAHGSGLQKSDDPVDAEKTGLDTGGADIIGHYVFFHTDFSLFQSDFSSFFTSSWENVKADSRNFSSSCTTFSSLSKISSPQ